MTTPRLVERVKSMQAIARRLAREGKSIRLVPTMGALHAGHASLIQSAIEDRDHDDHEHEHDSDDGDPGDANSDSGALNGRNRTSGATSCEERRVIVVVSIFVNPIQFNDPSDLAKYPKTLEADLEMCRRLGVDFVFMPSCNEIYRTAPRRGGGAQSSPLAKVTREMCTVMPPHELAHDLEGKSRANHFQGMLTIVNKLFNITRPERAYFGEKDYQQLVLVRAMSEDLDMQVKICPGRTVRERDTCLPLSSRNVRLTLEQRHLAAQLMSETLFSTRQVLEDKCSRGSAEIDLVATLLASMVTSQVLLDIREDDITDHHHYYGELNHVAPTGGGSTRTSITIDYFELRCAEDLSPIRYNESGEGFYDCQRACCSRRRHSAVDKLDSAAPLELEARLLMSIWVSNIRLLDNVGVRLNLDSNRIKSSD